MKKMTKKLALAKETMLRLDAGRLGLVEGASGAETCLGCPGPNTGSGNMFCLEPNTLKPE